MYHAFGILTKRGVQSKRKSKIFLLPTLKTQSQRLTRHTVIVKDNPIIQQMGEKMHGGNPE